MEQIKHLTINNFDYNLPEHFIAKYPLNKRDNSKLLVYNKGLISESVFNKIDQFLPSNSLLVSNNTKVIQARLNFFKSTGAHIEVFCLEPYSPTDYQQIFTQTKSCQWQCIVGNQKKWKQGKLTHNIETQNGLITLSATRIGETNTAHIIEFEWDNANICFGQILDLMGKIPIPPYLNRQTEPDDTQNYQTVYSKIKGSVAAPTAGLHFTPSVIGNLKLQGINMHEITLHVGAGTFKPVQSVNVSQHQMHHEQIILTKNSIPELIKNIGNITAVGTTTVRTLESIYWLGVKILSGYNNNNELILEQWEPYSLKQNINVADALNALQNYIVNNSANYIKASTGIMIVPGYKFKTISRLITNFHQPKSTLLLLIGAFIGNDWQKMYNYALNNQFRFLSYGDSCLLMP